MGFHKLLFRLCGGRQFINSYKKSRHFPHIVSTNHISMNAATKPLNNEEEKFQSYFPSFMDYVINKSTISQEPFGRERIQRLIDYTIPGGKRLRGLMTVYAYNASAKPEHITEESMEKARILGWCVELLQASYLNIDDIIDKASTRRGKPCWYTLPDVGMCAFNDYLMIQGIVNEILMANFNGSPNYLRMLHLIDKVMIYTGIGECLDYNLAHNNSKDYTDFTMEQYKTTATYKGAHYTFKLPVMLGYYFANNSNEELHRKVEDICLGMGRLYQVQNDVLDCFGETSLVGKPGNDIEEGKCTWLAVNALRLCSAAQRAEFVHNYAHSDPARVHAVKRLYQDLNLLELYRQEETTLYDNLQNETNTLPKADRQFFDTFLTKIYKRKR